MFSKTRVLLLHNIVSPHVTPIFQELAKKCDLKVLYCAQSERNRSNWKETPSGFIFKILTHMEIRFSGKDLFTYFINLDILKELRESNPDVVIISGWDLFSYQITALYCYFNKIPYILWSGSTHYEDSWRRFIAAPLVRLIVAGAHSYISYGTRAKEYLTSLGADSQKIIKAMNSTNTQNYKLPSPNQKKSALQLKSRLGLQDKNVILFYGQMIERKGVDILIKAFSVIQLKYPETALLLIGTGREEAHFKRLTQSLNLKNVVFLSDPGDRKMPLYYYLSSFFVLPSREEVWGLVINQAMLCGVPVLASTAVGATADLIVEGQTGYTFLSESEKDLVRKMELMLKNTYRKKIVNNAWKKVQATHPSSVANQIYKAILRAKQHETKNK